MTYTSELADVSAAQLQGFFVGWPKPPSAETLLRLLHASKHRVLAIEGGRVVGYITALSDGVMFGYISSLEVLPEFQMAGIGKQLVTKILEEMRELYAIDLVCDPEVQPFYERCGLRHCSAMIVRRYEKL